MSLCNKATAEARMLRLRNSADPLLKRDRVELATLLDQLVAEIRQLHGLANAASVPLRRPA